MACVKITGDWVILELCQRAKQIHCDSYPSFARSAKLAYALYWCDQSVQKQIKSNYVHIIKNRKRALSSEHTDEEHEHIGPW